MTILLDVKVISESNSDSFAPVFADASCMHIILVWSSVTMPAQGFFSHGVIRTHQSRHSIMIYFATCGDVTVSVSSMSPTRSASLSAREVGKGRVKILEYPSRWSGFHRDTPTPAHTAGQLPCVLRYGAGVGSRRGLQRVTACETYGKKLYKTQHTLHRTI